MKKLMILILLAIALGVPRQSEAWVTYAHAGYGHVGYAHVGYYHAGWGCGGVSTGTAVAAGVAGLAAGAMIGAATHPAVVVAPSPVYVTPAPVYVAPAPVYVPPTAPVGSIYYSLPYGAQSANINGVQYYVLGSTYYRAYFGNNGVYYQVAPNPI